MTDLEIQYLPEARGEFPLLEEMYVERGTRADWELLHELHYKSGSEPVGANYYRCVFQNETVGVVVFGMPRPLLKERNLLYPRLKPGGDTKITNVYRYKWVNSNFRILSRMVVDTMFRSVGVAYRMANLTARMTGFPHVEIQSSMSKYNQFAQRAGFKFVKPMRSQHYEAGLKFFRRNFRAHPADQEAILAELEAMPSAVKKKVIEEMKKFYFDHSPLEKTGARRKFGTSRVDEMTPKQLVGNIQQLCLASPLYGIYDNPDAGQVLPERIPLLAFDNQDVSEPLKWKS